jgi:hypothetical protein
MLWPAHTPAVNDDLERLLAAVMRAVSWHDASLHVASSGEAARFASAALTDEEVHERVMQPFFELSEPRAHAHFLGYSARVGKIRGEVGSVESTTLLRPAEPQMSVECRKRRNWNSVFVVLGNNTVCLWRDGEVDPRQYRVGDEEGEEEGR